MLVYRRVSFPVPRYPRAPRRSTNNAATLLALHRIHLAPQGVVAHLLGCQGRLHVARLHDAHGDLMGQRWSTEKLGQLESWEFRLNKKEMVNRMNYG